MKTDIPETVIHTSYIPWLARVDALIGKPARLDLARHTSFIAAWQEGLSPHEAVADAKISGPRDPSETTGRRLRCRGSTTSVPSRIDCHPTGRVNRKVAPWPTVGETHIRPP